MNVFYKAGRALAIQKLSGARVEVTNDQTYQRAAEPAFINDAQAQAGSIDATWDAHDRRRHTQAIGEAVHPLAGSDG